MTEAIIVAILSLVGTLAGSYFSSRKSAALVAYRLEQLEKKVDKHNRFAERVPIMEEQIKVINHWLSELEHEHQTGGN